MRNIMGGGWVGIGNKIRKFGKDIDDIEEKISRLFQKKDLAEGITGEIGKTLKKEFKEGLSSTYKEVNAKKKGIIKKENVPPMIPEEAEIWIRKIYTDKHYEDELRENIQDIIDSISDENEKIKARRYLSKFQQKVIRAAALAKDYSVQIESYLERQREKTKTMIDEIREKKKEESLAKIITNYLRKIGRYVIQVVIPAGGIKLLENTFQFVKDADFLQKAAIAFGVFAIEEWAINTYLEKRRRKKIEELYNNYDKEEAKLKEKARRITNFIIRSTIKEISEIARRIYGYENEEEQKLEGTNETGEKVEEITDRKIYDREIFIEMVKKKEEERLRYGNPYSIIKCKGDPEKIIRIVRGCDVIGKDNNDILILFVNVDETNLPKIIDRLVQSGLEIEGTINCYELIGK